MSSNRGRQFYRSDFVPSLMARQRGNHVDNHNYMQRLIASDPMYNNISWMDEYTAYFRPNFFPPNPSFSRRGEFTAVPREMMNTNNRPFLIKYPPTIRDLQDMGQRRRHRMPKWIRTRTFWSQKRTDETQEVDQHNRQEREARESTECSNWRNSWRDLDYPADDEEEVTSYKDDEETSSCSEALGGQELNMIEDGGSGEPVTEDSLILEQKDILELLQECDYQHEMFIAAGIGWYEGQTQDYDSPESNEDIEVIVKMPDMAAYTSFDNDENLNPNSKMNFKQASAKWKLGSMWNRKRRKVENNDVKRRIAEIKGKREKLMIRRANLDGKKRSRTSSGFRYLFEATKTSNKIKLKLLVKSPNSSDSLSVSTSHTSEKSLIGRTCSENDIVRNNKCQKYKENLARIPCENLCNNTISTKTVKVENTETALGTCELSNHLVLDSFSETVERNIVKSLLGTMLSCKNMLFSRKWDLLSLTSASAATTMSNLKEHKIESISDDFTSEMTEWINAKIPDKNRDIRTDCSPITSNQKSIGQNDASSMQAKLNEPKQEKQISKSEDLLVIYDKVFEHVNVSDDFFNEMMSYIEEARVHQKSSTNNNGANRKYKITEKANNLEDKRNLVLCENLPLEAQRGTNTTNSNKLEYRSPKTSVGSVSVMKNSLKYALIKKDLKLNSTKDTSILEQNHFTDLDVDSSTERKIITSTPEYKQAARNKNLDLSLEIPPISSSDLI